MRELWFRPAFPFGGSVAGAQGFLDAAGTRAVLCGAARFERVGGAAIDPFFGFATSARVLQARTAKRTAQVGMVLEEAAK